MWGGGINTAKGGGALWHLNAAKPETENAGNLSKAYVTAAPERVGMWRTDSRGFFYGGSPDVPGDGPPRERRTRVYRPAMSVDMQNGVFFFFAFF